MIRLSGSTRTSSFVHKYRKVPVLSVNRKVVALVYVASRIRVRSAIEEKISFNVSMHACVNIPRRITPTVCQIMFTVLCTDVPIIYSTRLFVIFAYVRNSTLLYRYFFHMIDMYKQMI